MKAERCLVIINSGKNGAEALADGIARELGALGMEAVPLRFHGGGAGEQSAKALAASCSRAVTLGGDGTALYAARLCAPLGIPVLSVNLGSFGFLCGVEKDAWREELRAFALGHSEPSRRAMAEAEIIRGGVSAEKAAALNDIVIAAEKAPRLITLRAACNGAPLGVFKADAVIAATATGSTAYSAAAGGPIIDPSLDVFVLTPVCPFSLSARPLVLPGGSVLSFESAGDGRIQAHADGQPLPPAGAGDTIIIRKSQYTALLHAGNAARFYAALRSKMNWAGGPRA